MLNDAAPRQVITFHCRNRHETTKAFALSAPMPDEWDCGTCGAPAGRDPKNPPPPVTIEPFKTHLTYVQERRNSDEQDEILTEALGRVPR